LWPYWEGRFDDALKIQAHWRGTTQKGGVSFLMNSWVEALAHGSNGRYERALAILEDVLVTGKRMGEPFWLARALNTVGWIYSELQDHHRAMKWNMRGVEAAQEANFSIPEAESNARLNLGDNLMALGRLDEAEKHFQEVEQVARNPRPQDHNMLWRYSQHLFHSFGELWLIRGNTDKAIAYADECLTLAERSKSRKNIAKGRRLRGQVFLAQGKLAEAEQELSTALEVAQQVGNPTQLWMTHAALARLFEKMKQQDLEQEHWQAADAIVQLTADGIQDNELRETFTNAAPVREIMEHAKQ
jgi:tetratricopeptide (TPR) repeat protein